MLKYIASILLLFIFLIAVIPTNAASNYHTYKTLIFEDEFNYVNDTEASAHWYIWRENNDPTKEIIWNSTGSYVNITVAVNGANAGIFFKTQYGLTNYTNWQIDFIAYIGNATTTYPADGMALVIYHNLQLGFGGENMGARRNGSVGYLIEFDPYLNTGEPAVPHVALASATAPAYQHMYIFYTAPGSGYVNDTWIYVRVIFNETERGSNYIKGILNITLWNNVDRVAKQPIGSPVFQSEITVTFTDPSEYIGFTAATGGLNEEHKLDWVRIALYPPPPVGGVLSNDKGTVAMIPLLLAVILVIGIGSILVAREKY